MIKVNFKVKIKIPGRKSAKLPALAFFLVFLTFFCWVLIPGCTSLVQKAGEALDGELFKERTTAVYRSDKQHASELREVSLQNGERTIVLSSGTYPGLKLRGSLPSEDGVFSFTEAEILSTYVHGWNHFTLDVLGEAFFTPFTEDGDKGTLSILNPPERIQISGGKIRYKDNRITGSSALTNLRNRRERILALTEWMKEFQNNGPEGNGVVFSFSNQNEFEKYWKSRLFPELVSKKERPQEYSEENAEWVRSNGIKWNKSYTSSVFPEELWELRNSGALLRDFEEGLDWIYIEYTWDGIAAFFEGQEFRKIK